MRQSLKTYTELSRLKTFDERFKYLQLNCIVGEETFGFDRYINQKFYRAPEWRRIRDHIIVRDNGCDLGVDDRIIHDRVIIHHINPILVRDIVDITDVLVNPEYLILTCHNTHNAIHYGSEEMLYKPPIERRKNDTCPWR